jgi:hypothetical protein
MARQDNKAARAQGLIESCEADREKEVSVPVLESSELRKLLLGTQQTQPHHLSLGRSIRQILSRSVLVQSSAQEENGVGHTEGAKD